MRAACGRCHDGGVAPSRHHCPDTQPSTDHGPPTLPHPLAVPVQCRPRCRPRRCSRPEPEPGLRAMLTKAPGSSPATRRWPTRTRASPRHRAASLGLVLLCIPAGRVATWQAGVVCGQQPSAPRAGGSAAIDRARALSRSPWCGGRRGVQTAGSCILGGIPASAPGSPRTRPHAGRPAEDQPLDRPQGHGHGHRSPPSAGPPQGLPLRRGEGRPPTGHRHPPCQEPPEPAARGPAALGRAALWPAAIPACGMHRPQGCLLDHRAGMARCSCARGSPVLAMLVACPSSTPARHPCQMAGGRWGGGGVVRASGWPPHPQTRPWWRDAPAMSQHQHPACPNRPVLHEPHRSHPSRPRVALLVRCIGHTIPPRLAHPNTYAATNTGSDHTFCVGQRRELMYGETQ
jgi:hypothetical protein